MNVGRWRGGVSEECWIEQKEEWKDGEEVNEESDAPGRLPLVPDIQMHTHARN